MHNKWVYVAAFLMVFAANSECLAKKKKRLLEDSPSSESSQSHSSQSYSSRSFSSQARGSASATPQAARVNTNPSGPANTTPVGGSGPAQSIGSKQNGERTTILTGSPMTNRTSSGAVPPPGQSGHQPVG